jgi:hypothetical protein
MSTLLFKVHLICNIIKKCTLFVYRALYSWNWKSEKKWFSFLSRPVIKCMFSEKGARLKWYTTIKCTPRVECNAHELQLWYTILDLWAQEIKCTLFSGYSITVYIFQKLKLLVIYAASSVLQLIFSVQWRPSTLHMSSYVHMFALFF